MQKWQISSVSLRNGKDTFNVEIDETLGRTVRVGTLEAIELFGRSLPVRATNTPRRLRRSRTATQPVAAEIPTPSGRKNEWVLTPLQLQKIVAAVEKRDPKLRDLELQVLESRFVNPNPIPTKALTQQLGLKWDSQITELTRSGLKTLGIRVRKLRKFSRRRH